MGIWCSEDRIEAARHADLYDYLLFNHSEDFHAYNKSLRLKCDDNVSIPRGYSGFCRFGSDSKDYIYKGNSIDFLMQYYDYDFQEAVFALTEDMDMEFDDEVIDEDIEERIARHKKNQAKIRSLSLARRAKNEVNKDGSDIVLPEKSHEGYRRLYGYLVKTRGIDAETIDFLIEKHLIYQDVLGNVVFVNHEKSWAEKRWTNTFIEKRCRYADSCERYTESDYKCCGCMGVCTDYKKVSTHQIVGGSKSAGYWSFSSEDKAKTDQYRIYICEAAIDAISLFELHRLKNGSEGIKGGIYVSIGGAGKQKTIEGIKDKAMKRGIKKSQIYIAVDSDDAGEACRKRNEDLLYILPEHKDWNDDLKAYKGMI